jgi:hypothetical protein
MTNTVKELEAQLKEAKQQELKERWEVYLDEVKSFCRKLVGRVVVTEGTSRSLSLLKITGYKEQYYIDISGYYGQFGPERWLELETEGYIQFRMRRGKYSDYGPRVLDRIEDCSVHNFVFKKGSRIDIAKLDFTNLSLDRGAPFTPHTIKFGHTEYNEYRYDPKYERALTNFMMFTRLMPDTSIYDRAVKLYLKQVDELAKFWLENSSEFNDLERVDTLFKANY